MSVASDKMLRARMILKRRGMYLAAGISLYNKQDSHAIVRVVFLKPFWNLFTFKITWGGFH